MEPQYNQYPKGSVNYNNLTSKIEKLLASASDDISKQNRFQKALAGIGRDYYKVQEIAYSNYTQYPLTYKRFEANEPMSIAFNIEAFKEVKNKFSDISNMLDRRDLNELISFIQDIRGII
ncbi:hypothetical protein [uncultured Shewanella sp.]|uniref:hypothetical protein n=1 Tax=uncultured Shewanella sp. TaxID=173975 RepID=UPI0026398992|nr:hypothetical protein [uncultured Shewanella sp.]